MEFSQEETVQKYVLPGPEDEPHLWLETGDGRYVARWETQKDLSWFVEQLQGYVEEHASNLAGRQASALFESEDEDNYRLEGSYERVASEDGFTETCTYLKVDFVSYHILWEEGEPNNHVTVAEYPHQEPLLDPLRWFYMRSHADRESVDEELEDVIEQVEEDL